MTDLATVVKHAQSMQPLYLSNIFFSFTIDTNWVEGEGKGEAVIYMSLLLLISPLQMCTYKYELVSMDDEYVDCAHRHFVVST